MCSYNCSCALVLAANNGYIMSGERVMLFFPKKLIVKTIQPNSGQHKMRTAASSQTTFPGQ